MPEFIQNYSRNNDDLNGYDSARPRPFNYYETAKLTVTLNADTSDCKLRVRPFGHGGDDPRVSVPGGPAWGTPDGPVPPGGIPAIPPGGDPVGPGGIPEFPPAGPGGIPVPDEDPAGPNDDGGVPGITTSEWCTGKVKASLTVKAERQTRDLNFFTGGSQYALRGVVSGRESPIFSDNFRRPDPPGLGERSPAELTTTLDLGTIECTGGRMQGTVYVMIRGSSYPVTIPAREARAARPYRPARPFREQERTRRPRTQLVIDFILRVEECGEAFCDQLEVEVPSWAADTFTNPGQMRRGNMLIRTGSNFDTRPGGVWPRGFRKKVE